MRVLFAWSIICVLTVALGQEPCVRTSGFIPLSNLTVLAQSPSSDIFDCTDDVCLRHEQQRLIPQIKFTCSGTITKWTFAALFGEFFIIFPLTEYPELQLWRLDNGQTNTYTKVGNCTTSNVDEENPSRIYECIPSSPLPFQVGDVLGIFQPSLSRLSVYYDVRIGPLNYFEEFDPGTATTSFNSFDITGTDTQTETALPLVTVEILVDCGSLTRPMNGQVTVTTTTLDSTATYSCEQGYDLMGESMRTCQTNGQWSDQPPVCTSVDCGNLTDPENGQVTLTGTTLDSTATYSCNTGYNLVGTSTRICRNDGMWSDQPPVCTPVTPSPVVPSTPVILSSSTSEAISTPDNIPTSTSQFVEGSSGESTSPTTSVQPVSETPTPQAPTDDPTDTMIPPQESSTASEPQESSTASLPPGGNNGTSSTSSIVAGAIIGGVVALLLVFIAIVLLLILRRRRRKQFRTMASDGAATGNIENPVYSGDVSGKYIGAKEGTANNDYDDIAISSSGVYQYIDEQPQHYEEPVESTRAVTNGVPATGRRYIYNTLSSSATASKPLAAESLYEELAGAKSAFYQWGVYVPSEEERRNFATGEGQTTSEENVYAALGEAQFKADGHVSSGSSPTFFEDSNTYWAPSSDKSELYGQLATKKYREIPRHQVQITDHLGEGQFGTVNKGIWQSPAGAKEVAVKTLKSQASEMDAVKFLQEAAINGQFKHPNVVKLFGVVTIGEPVMIVLESLANGDLRHYLKKQQPVPGELIPSSTPPMLLNFCQQVAAGMEYLARKAFVHRDLAARNILVSEDKTCKVSDFGMSRDLADENYYVSHGGKIPVKWTAPEALHYKKYSTASDVWSFGVVMYEIWSLGHKPFEGRTNAESIKLVDSGYRLPPPPGCAREMYKWMIRCWHPEQYTRPQFSQLSEALNQPDLDLLTWSEEDAGVHPQAMVLGAPLEAGKQLYPELQDIYVEKRSSATQIATL